MRHSYEYGAAPPLAVAVNVVGWPVHLFSGSLVPIVTEGDAFSEIVTGAVAIEQQPASVTVSVYVPAPAAIDWVAAPFDQAYELQPAGPVSVAVPPAQTELCEAVISAVR